jgi:hypothetical protein
MLREVLAVHNKELILIQVVPSLDDPVAYLSISLLPIEG